MSSKHIKESCHIKMSHIWMSHVPHMNESRPTYEWVMSYQDVPHTNESCHESCHTQTMLRNSMRALLPASRRDEWKTPSWCRWNTERVRETESNMSERQREQHVFKRERENNMWHRRVQKYLHAHIKSEEWLLFGMNAKLPRGAGETMREQEKKSNV